MITILNQRNNKTQSFNHYDHLYKHFIKLEKVKASGNIRETLNGWTVTRHSYQRVLSFCQYVVRQKKDKKGLDVLEICQGAKKPLLIPVTPMTNMAALQKQWCKSYCEAHGYQIEETPNSSDSEAATDGGTHDNSV